LKKGAAAKGGNRETYRGVNLGGSRLDGGHRPESRKRPLSCDVWRKYIERTMADSEKAENDRSKESTQDVNAFGINKVVETNSLRDEVGAKGKISELADVA